MKKLLLGAVAVATLSTASFASMEGFEDFKNTKGYDLAVKNGEYYIKSNSQNGGYKIGNFYGKTGASVNYLNILDVNFDTEIPNATYYFGELGANGKDKDSIFANAGIKTYFLPFAWENTDSFSSVAKSGLALTAGITGTTFSYETSKTIEKLDEFGWDTITETVKSDERVSDFVAHAGFYFKDEFGLTNSDIELTLGKGLLGNIDSEVALRTNTMITEELALSFEAKRTNIDSEDYNTFNVGLNYKF